jgi:hypothetical protein
MLDAIATLAVTFVVILFPILIPATLTAVDALAQLRRSRTQAEAGRSHTEYVGKPSPASV